MNSYDRDNEHEPLREITVAECRAASDNLALTHALHAEHRRAFTYGQRYNPYNDDDRRIYIDAVFVPDGYHIPESIVSWYSKGGGYSHPDEPGTWMFNVGLPELDVTTPTLFDGLAM